jgi:hypothetical protein
MPARHVVDLELVCHRWLRKGGWSGDSQPYHSGKVKGRLSLLAGHAQASSPRSLQSNAIEAPDDAAQWLFEHASPVSDTVAGAAAAARFSSHINRDQCQCRTRSPQALAEADRPAVMPVVIDT